MIHNSFFKKITRSEILKSFGVTTLGSTLSKFIMVLSTIYLANVITKNEFGEFSFIRNTLNMIFCICAVNFVGIVIKFTTEAKKSDRSLQRLFILFIFSLTVCGIVGITLLVLPQSFLLSIFGTNTILYVFKVVGLLLPLFMLQPLVEGVLRGLLKFKLISYMQICSSILMFAFIAAGVFLNGLAGAIYGLLSYYSIYSLFSLFLLIYLKPRDLRSRLNGFWSERRVVISMILPVFIMSFWEAPIFWISQVLMARYGDMGDIGSFTAIQQVRNLIILIPTYFFNTFTAYAGNMNAEKKYALYYHRFDRLEVYMLYAGLALFVVLSICSKYILFLYGEQYILDWKFLILASSMIPFMLLTSLYRIDLIIHEKQTILLYVSLLWNGVFLLLIYIMLVLNIGPVLSFFSAQWIGYSVMFICYFVVYKKVKSSIL